MRLRSISSAVLALALLAPLGFVHSAAAQAAPGETETKIKDWALVCHEGNTAVRGNCILQQRLTPKDMTQDLLVVGVMFRADSTSPTIAFRMPKEAVANDKLTMTIDKGPTMSLPIEKCDANFCGASAPLTDKVLPMLTNGSTGLVTFPMKIKDKDGKEKTQRFGVKVSLNGFTAALTQLKAKAGVK